MEPNGAPRGRPNWHADIALRITGDRTAILCGGCRTLNGGADFCMKVMPVARISGALLFQPEPHVDERGFFSRTFDADVAR
jgi:hypothetical protein